MSHVCNHPNGKSHICQCRSTTSHGSHLTDCSRYESQAEVSKVDPHEESSPFVTLVDMPDERTF